MDDPKKIAMMLIGKQKSKKPDDDEGDMMGAEDEGEEEPSGGAEAFASAVKLAMEGDHEAAFDALKVAVSACGEDY